MSTINLTQEKFLEAYDECADDIFEYCLSETSHREASKILTRAIFTEAWDTIACYGIESIPSIKKLLFRTAKDKVSTHMTTQEREMRYRESLWNLTLSQ